MYQVISFDLFMTLADLNARVPVMWERVMGRALTNEDVARHAKGLRSCYLPYYHALCEPPFVSMRSVFRRGFAEYFQVSGMHADPDQAAEIFLEEHNASPLYEDALALLPRLEGRFRIVISTDADCNMVKDLLPRIPHERAFVSEELGVYKANRSGAFFRRVLAETGVRPAEILHVGDGRSDIIGAKCCGIDVYYVDRDRRGAPDTAEQPDYTAPDLFDLAALLGV